MKMERLYAITLHLLNHGRTSASALARRFEVSVRTIQRDVDSLCLAGIPIVASQGASGGYEIAEGFRMDKGLATSEDYARILTALEGLVSATGDQRARLTLEKIAPMAASDARGMLLDFSVLREGDQDALRLLQTAAAQKRAVAFTYTNNQGETRRHTVEPVAVLYRWYAWYLLAYSRTRDDYRSYKLVRMRELSLTDSPFTKEHAPAARVLEQADRTDRRRYLHLLLRCDAEARPRVMEYLNGAVVKELPHGGALIQTAVVEDEQLWLGTLLSLGGKAEVLEPEAVRLRLLALAEGTAAVYREA